MYSSFTHLTNIGLPLCTKCSSHFWGTEMKNAWFFPHKWWAEPRCEQVCLFQILRYMCTRFCFFTGQLCSCHSPAMGVAGSVLVLFLFQTSFSWGFSKNMKLEAVNPRNPGELCVASVVSVKGRLLWLHLEGLCNS
jgi:hypothetical protein